MSTKQSTKHPDERKKKKKDLFECCKNVECSLTLYIEDGRRELWIGVKDRVMKHSSCFTNLFLPSSWGGQWYSLRCSTKTCVSIFLLDRIERFKLIKYLPEIINGGACLFSARPDISRQRRAARMHFLETVPFRIFLFVSSRNAFDLEVNTR